MNQHDPNALNIDTFISPLPKSREENNSCPINCALELISKKWVLQIICTLDKGGRLRYSQLKKELNGISDLMLSRTLKELQQYNLIDRIQYEEVPVRVEYFLTEAGKNILPSFYRVAQWGLNIMTSKGQTCTCTDKCYVALHRFLQPAEVHQAEQYPQVWNEAYVQMGKRLETEELQKWSGINRLKWFMYGMIELLTSGDLEYNRMIVVYLNGQADPALTDHSRPHYAIISTLVDQCKSEGSITINMDTVRLTEFLIMLVNGMETDYLMGDKTTLETNKARLSWFLDTLQV